MRCMLVSFAVYNLWLDWRAVAAHLGRCFLDFEPGIHYPQLQMQAGTTGIDMRCYSVTKQAKEQDPKGDFIRRHVPELFGIRDASILEPWKIKCPNGGVVAGYVPRIVDELKTSKASKTVIAELQERFLSGGAGERSRHLAAPLNERPAGQKKRNQRFCEDAEPSDELDIMALLSQSASKRRRGGAAPRQDAAATGLGGLARGGGSAAGAWACPRCTLLNGNESSTAPSPAECEACGLPRPEESPATPARITIELD